MSSFLYQYLRDSNDPYHTEAEVSVDENGVLIRLWNEGQQAALGHRISVEDLESMALVARHLQDAIYQKG